jgi:hypothetical protein
LLSSALAIAVLAVLVSCSRDGQVPSPVRYLDAEEDYHFETICEMARTSDAVVEATAVSTQPGRILGDPDDLHSALQVREVNLRITDTLRGLLPTSEIVLEEIAWDWEGNPLALEGQTPSMVGDIGLYFVVAKDDPTPRTYYRIVNSQGKFLYKGDDVVSTIANDPLVRQIEEMSVREVRLVLDQDLETGDAVCSEVGVR